MKAATALAAALAPTEDADLRAKIDALGPWFHNLDLAGVRTAPDHFLGDYPAVKFRRFADALPADMSGKSVLDIGCNAGFYSFEMARRGAAEVLGIDWDDRYLAQARLAAEIVGVTGVTFEKLSVFDVALLGRRFDLVIFMGVLYHLRHPLLALDLVREHVAGDLLLFQTMQRGSDAVFDVPQDHPFHMPGTFEPPPWFEEPGYPRLHFIEHRYAGDHTNWWVPNHACSEAMLRSAGFRILQRPEEEVYLCRVADLPGDAGVQAVYPARPQSGATA